MPDTEAAVWQRWFRRFRPVSEPRIRLVCLPHAGGGANAYHAWAARLPADVELLSVCYPGRQNRMSEPGATRMEQLAEPVAEALAGLGGPPFALFGHSIGAAVAFEAARCLDRASAAMPTMLFVSGRVAPRLGRGEPPRQAGDAGLLAEAHRLSGFDPAVLADPAVRNMIMPALRADYDVLDTYRPDPQVAVPVPIVGYVGDRDPDTSVDDICAWSTATLVGFDHRVFPGDHFYLVAREAELVADIAARL